MGEPQRLIVGLGTGRCGTHSLAELLELQNGTTALHQPEPCLPWTVDHGWYHHVQEVIAGISGPFVALIAWYYLNYVNLLIRDHDATVICLRRDRSETIHSIDRMTPEFDHWSNRPARANPTTEYRGLFPNYDVPDKRTALGLYYDEYYGRAERLQRTYPKRVRIFSTTDLNHEASVVDLLSFAGYAENDMTVAVGIRTGIMEPFRWRSSTRDSRSRGTE